MKARMRFGPLKRSCSSINLTQLGCPEHCEPPVIIHTHRSCGSSPARSRPHHCHEIYDLEQSEVACKCSPSDASEQMISHTTTSRPLKRSRRQIFYPTGYFNALDVATGIRNALHGCKQGGVCVSNNRTLQRLDLRPTPMLQNSSNFENCNVGTTCVEDVPLGLGLATVLCPKVSHDVGFQIQKRAPRGLAAVIDADCTCSEIGPQIVSSEHCHDPCPRPGLPLPSLQEFHQKVASSSPRNSQVITNIDMLEKFKVPRTCELGAESVGSSRTSVRMETEVQRDPEHSCLGYNSDDTELSEISLRTSTRWGRPLRDGRRSQDMRPLSKRKRRSSMTSSSFREPQPSSSFYREPSREFDPDEDALHEELQRMSFNETRKRLPRCPSWMRPDSDQGGPKRLSISVPAPGSQRRGSESLSISVVSEPSDVNSEQDDIELEDNRWPSSNAGGSSKTSVVSFSQSTGKPNNRDSGSGGTYSVQVSSSNDTRSDDMANKEEIRDSSESLRNIVHDAVHQAVQGQLTMQKAMQKAVHQELSQRSSSFESDESQRRSPRPSTCTSSSNEQSAYAQIVANATKKTQEILDETQAALTSRARSKSRPNSRISSINNLRSGSSSSSGRSSGQARLNFKDHRTSITELLNSMNSVTQLLNSLPLQGDNDRLSIATRRSAGPQRGSERSPSRIQSSQWLSANRGSGRSFQQQQYDMGLARGSQRLPSNMGGRSLQQQQYDMGARSSQQPQFYGGSGGSFQQQPQYDMGGMSTEQSQRDMEAGGSEGSFSQGYPNPRSSGQGITQNWYGRDMPLGQGSQFAFDPNRPRSQSMPGGSQLVYGWNSSMRQPKRASRGSMLNRRSPSGNSRLQSSSMMGQRGSQGIMSQQGQRRSRLSASSYNPNESEMTAKSSLVFDQNEPTAYPEEIINTVINESEEGASNTIPNADDSTYQSESPEGEFRQSQVGEFPQSLEEDGSLSPLPEGDVYQVSENMDGDQQQEEYGSGQDEQPQGITVNCQPNIQSEMLGRVPELLQSQVKRLKGSPKNPIVTPSPTPPAKTEQFDLHANNPKTMTSSETLIETNKVKPNVAPPAKLKQFDNNTNNSTSRTLAKTLVGTDRAKPTIASSSKPEQFHLDSSSLMTKTSSKRLRETDRAKPNVSPSTKPDQFPLDASSPITRISAKMLRETDMDKPNAAPQAKPEQFHLDASSPMTRTSAKMLKETDRAKPNLEPPAKPEQFHLDASNPMTRTSEKVLIETGAKPNGALLTKPEECHRDASNHMTRTLAKMLIETDRAKPNVALHAKSEQYDLDASNPKAKTSEEMLREIDRAKPNVALPAKAEQFDLDASNRKAKTSEEMLREIDRAKPNVAPPAKREKFDLDVSNPKSKSSEEMLTETGRAKPNVAETPCEFQHDLHKIRSHTFQDFEFVKPETQGRKSLSNTLCAMIQELEVLESRNRQKSAAYEFIKTSTQQRVLPKAIAL